MAEDIVTALRFIGDSKSAEAAINSLVNALKNAAATATALFANVTTGSNQSTAAINQASAAADRAKQKPN